MSNRPEIYKRTLASNIEFRNTRSHFLTAHTLSKSRAARNKFWSRSVGEGSVYWADIFKQALTRPHPQKLSLAEDLSNTQEVLSSIREALEKKNLSEREGDALVTFVVSQFVARRFESMLDTLELDPMQEQTFSVMRRHLSA